MHLLILQENGRHDANRAFRECNCLHRAFTALGHSVTLWGLGHDGFDELPDWQSYDAILCLEDYDNGWHPSLASVKVPKVAWIRDSHCGLDRYQGWAARHRFDIIFCAVLPHVGAFAQFAPLTLWLPNAVDETLVYPHAVERNVPLGFVGNVNASGKRAAMLAALQKRYDMQVDHWVLGAEMVRRLSSYRICWNCSISNDLNCRVFEATAAGCCLLTNNTPGLDCAYKSGEEIVVYDDEKGMHDAIQYLVDRPTVAATIAEAGRRRTLAEHTYTHRAGTILAELKRMGV